MSRLWLPTLLTLLHLWTQKDLQVVLLHMIDLGIEQITDLGGIPKIRNILQGSHLDLLGGMLRRSSEGVVLTSLDLLHILRKLNWTRLWKVSNFIPVILPALTW